MEPGPVKFNTVKVLLQQNQQPKVKPMSNRPEFNSCSGLITDETLREVDELFDNDKRDTLDALLELQNELQEELGQRYPGRTIPPLLLQTKGELVDFLMDQKRAFDDEFNELILSIAGSSKTPSEQSAIWKKWKSNYSQLRNELINENLSEAEQYERDFEMVDIMHFVNNMLLALDFNSEKLYKLYYLKNLENLRRYKSNY